MGILIGGSPATGSSLLRQMLNRHPHIYCGPELQLFCYPDLFSNWDKAKRRLYRKPLMTAPSIHPLKGVHLSGREQTWSEKEVIQLLNSSGEFHQFVEEYFNRPISIHAKTTWAEKTPENVLTFGQYLQNWKGGYVVHIVRDPFDTIASLYARGFSIFYATARYLFNVAHGLALSEHQRYIEVKYEELVTDPVSALEKLTGRLGLDTSAGDIEAMLQPGNPVLEETDQLYGWRSSEIDRPNAGSIGRFLDLDDATRTLAYCAARHMRISDGYSKEKGIRHTDLSSIKELLGYKTREPEPLDTSRELKQLKREMRGYRWLQVRHGNVFFEREKPLEISAH